MAKHNPFLSAADSARLDSWMVDIAADELGSVTESGDDYRVGANRSLVIHRTGAFHDFSAGIGGFSPNGQTPRGARPTINKPPSTPQDRGVRHES